MSSSGIHALLGVELVAATAERVELRLEVGPKVHQPFGILHGGVSALLAESAASIGGARRGGRRQHASSASSSTRTTSGSMREGMLTAVATPVSGGPAHPGLDASSSPTRTAARSASRGARSRCIEMPAE